MQKAGIVKYFDPWKGIGFILPDGGNTEPLFFHQRETVDYHGIQKGTPVTFFIKTDRSGKPCATRVRAAAKFMKPA